MNRSEQIMLTYFEDKESYTAFKLKYNVQVGKGINGWRNTELRVLDSTGNIHSYEGKPSCISTGRLYVSSGTPVYSIGWYDIIENESGRRLVGRSRPSDEGPHSIVVESGRRGVGPTVSVVYSNYIESLRDEQIAADREALRAAHKKATSIDFDKFGYYVNENKQ